jgi:serine/threonine protein kinase
MLRGYHRWLYALPAGEMPQCVHCNGQTFQHVRTFKHDFFAATGLYQGPNGLAVLKLGRQGDLFGFPLRWIGRFLAAREARLYRLVNDLPGVPRFIGTVGDTGLLHAYVPGHPLGRNEVVNDEFFNALQHLLAALHARHIAYVDLNKRQNILMGDDGRPHLIDFQISLRLSPAGWRRLAPLRWLLARFQHADCYHCLKHKRRLRPDLLTPEELAVLEKLSIWIRLHRVVARPLIQARRWLLQRVRRSETVTVTGSDAK